MDNPQVTAIAWLAGIWDGEGTISVRRNKRIKQISPRVSMVNTNPAIIQRVDELLTDLGVGHHVREKDQGGFEGSSRQCWIVSVETLGGACRLLNHLKPFLVGKLPQAELLGRFVASRMLRRQQVLRNSDCPYNEDELKAVQALYQVNGDQRGTSETIREAVEALKR